MCSGQSNMGFKLSSDWNGDLEAAASNLPNLRLISVPQVGTQELKNDFKRSWKASTPETARSFTAVGFLYARYMHEIADVPGCLIDKAWAVHAADAEIRRARTEMRAR